jgi:hypothetical protein
MVDDTTPEDTHEEAPVETDDPDVAAGRIEAALERIAHRIEHKAAAPGELAARLDGLIERLRAALGRSAA